MRLRERCFGSGKGVSGTAIGRGSGGLVTESFVMPERATFPGLFDSGTSSGGVSGLNDAGPFTVPAAVAPVLEPGLLMSSAIRTDWLSWVRVSVYSS